jgi:glycosyltransferase involved in cell wall biosynthesis
MATEIFLKLYIYCMPKLSYIIPCYYNELNIPVTAAELINNEKLFDDDISFEYVMIDDGSKDQTLQELKKFKTEYPAKVKIIKLSGNFGSYNAILAGMKYATGDCNVIISADLQDPPELVPKMIKHWRSGIKLIIANRQEREEPLVQRLFSNIYHYLIKKLALKNVPPGGYDLVLFDQKLRDEVVKINEKNTNQIYLLSWLQFEYLSIPYKRKKRDLGTSRWTFNKKVKLFIDSFVSFSFFPIRFISFFGLLFGILSLLWGGWVLIAKITGLIPVQGWATLMAVLLFVSAFQMIALGILGEYLWRTLDQVRGRPQYVIEEVFD